MNPRDELRRAFRVAGFAGFTVGMLGVYRAHGRLARQDQKDPLRERYVHAWSGGLLALFGIDVIVTGREHLGVAGAGSRARPDGGMRGRLVIANHRSTIDVGIVLREFGGHAVSREDLADWPVVGPAARSVGTVFVDRGSTESGVHAIRAMSRLLEAGQTVCVFPEGTTFSGDEVRPFHQGAFTAAKVAKADILPVGIAYESSGGAAFVNESFVQHLSRMAATRKTRVAVVIGELIEPQASTKKTAAIAHDAVASLVKEARRVVG